MGDDVGAMVDDSWIAEFAVVHDHEWSGSWQPSEVSKGTRSDHTLTAQLGHEQHLKR